MSRSSSRRSFLKRAAASGAAALGLSSGVRRGEAVGAKARSFEISLASYSLHRMIGTGVGKNSNSNIKSKTK